MRAAVIDRFGPDARFRMAELPTPEPVRGQLRLRIEAAGVNPVDAEIRAGSVPLIQAARFPMVLGWEAAGVIDAVGEGVTGWSVGDPAMCFSVYRLTQVGMYGDHVVLGAEAFASCPYNMDSVAAATLPAAGLTALQALEAISVSAGDRLLVMGAAGAVGGAITEIAVARGAEVIACVSAADIGRARELGAVHVVDRCDDVVALVRELTGGGADAAIDAAQGGAAKAAFDSVRDNGRFCTIVPASVPASGRGIDPITVIVQSDGAQMRELARLASEGAVTARVSRVLSLEDAAKAHELVMAGGLAGKVVLRVEAA
ncbi:MAG: NADP-dependent oxidoreductase [Egibacteraceae bacterium]